MVQRRFLRMLYEQAEAQGEPVDAFDVGQQAGLSRSQTTAVLKMMELSGWLVVHPGKQMPISFTERGRRHLTKAAP
jgi:DNA-binding MarR family transcriptional regulator